MRIFYKNNSRQRWRYWLLSLLVPLLGSVTLKGYAQDVGWQSGSPSVASAEVAAFSKSSITLDFTAGISDFPNASVEITFPEGVSYDSDAGVTAGASSGVTLGSAAYNGNVLSIPVTDGNIASKRVQFTVGVKTVCAEGDKLLSIAVKSDGTVITAANKEVSIKVMKPTVRLIAPNPSSSEVASNTAVNFSMNLDAVTADASSAKITFTVDQSTTVLSDFNLGGTAITATKNDKVYTLIVDEAFLGA